MYSHLAISGPCLTDMSGPRLRRRHLYFVGPDTVPDSFNQAHKRAATDRAFRQRLIDDPRAALAESGIEVSEGDKIVVIDAGERWHVIVFRPLLYRLAASIVSRTLVSGSAS